MSSEFSIITFVYECDKSINYCIGYIVIQVYEAVYVIVPH